MPPPRPCAPALRPSAADALAPRPPAAVLYGITAVACFGAYIYHSKKAPAVKKRRRPQGFEQEMLDLGGSSSTPLLKS